MASYVAAVTSNNTKKCMVDATTQLLATLQNNMILQGHPDTAVTGTFLSKEYQHYLGRELPHEQTGVLCANKMTMNLTTTCQLNLSPDLPPSAQKGHAFNDMDKTLVLVPVLCNGGCEVIFKKQKYK